MSKQISIRATHDRPRLDGVLCGPDYPDALHELHDLVYKAKVSASGLAAAFEGLDGFDPEKSASHPFVTDDGYKWYWAARFNWDGIGFVIAFPFAKDVDNKDGCPSDRMTAVYTTFEGGSANLGVIRTLQAMLQALKNWQATRAA